MTRLPTALRQVIRNFLRICPIAVVLWLSTAIPAPALLIVDQVYLYNFDNGAVTTSPSINLIGQDNWTGTTAGVSPTTVGTAEATYPTSGLRILGGSNSTGTLRRTNNGVFNFSIPDAVPRFDLEFLQTHGDSGISPNTGQALFGLSTSGTVELYFGLLPPPGPGVLNRPHWGLFNGASFVRDTADQDNGGWLGGGGASWRYRLQVDQFGTAGAGTAKASFFRTSISPNLFAPVGTEVAEPDLQNVTITGLPTLSSINQLYAQIGDFTRMDNLTVTTYQELVPEPSALALATIGLLSAVLLGWRLRRNR